MKNEIKNIKIELNKLKQISELKKSAKYHGTNQSLILKPQFSVFVNLYLNGKLYLPDHFPTDYTHTCTAMFFASIPNKREFELIKQKVGVYEVEMVDGNFRLYLTFENNGEDVKINIDFAFEDEEQYVTMKTSDLFAQFDQMWIDLVDALYDVYPKEIVDLEMNKIYNSIHERVSKGII